MNLERIKIFVYACPKSKTGLRWHPRDPALFSAPRFCRTWNTRFANQPAGIMFEQGYYRITIEDRQYYVHRLVYALHHGDIPTGHEIDHRDLNKANNAIKNLRLATRSQNNSNKIKYKTLHSTFKGVDKNGRGWRSRISVGGKTLHLGTFPDQEQAHAAYCKASDELHKEFSRKS